jgi:hypothetical protein
MQHGWHIHDCDQILIGTSGSGWVATAIERCEIGSATLPTSRQFADRAFPIAYGRHRGKIAPGNIAHDGASKIQQFAATWWICDEVSARPRPEREILPAQPG